jgi:hypothetical protein
MDISVIAFNRKLIVPKNETFILSSSTYLFMGITYEKKIEVRTDYF